MSDRFALHAIDWAVIGGYLGLAMLVGFTVRKRAGTGMRSYFLADRSLPCWWAGASIAVGGIVGLLVGVHRLLLMGESGAGLAWLAAGASALAWGSRSRAAGATDSFDTTEVSA